MGSDDGEKLGTRGRVPGGGVDAGTGGKISDEDVGMPAESTPASDSNVGIPTKGRVPGEAVDMGTGGRVSEEETYIPVAVAPPSTTYQRRITVAEDPYKYRIPILDVRVKRSGRPDVLSLLQEKVLMAVGTITKEFEQDYGQFAVSSVPIMVSNFGGLLDSGNPPSYFNGLTKDEIVEVQVIDRDTGEKFFKGVLSQKESDFDAETDEGRLEFEGLLKKYENVSAEMMWGNNYKDNLFKSIPDIVSKCLEEMETSHPGSIETIIQTPTLTGTEYSFSYYNRVNKDEVVNSIAVDENGIVYQCTEHKIYSFDSETGTEQELYSCPSNVSLCNLLYYNSALYFIEDYWQINPGAHWIVKLNLMSSVKTFIRFFNLYDREDFISLESKYYWEWDPTVDPDAQRRFYQGIGQFLGNLTYPAGGGVPSMGNPPSSPLSLNHTGFRYVDFAYPEITTETIDDYTFYPSQNYDIFAGRLEYLGSMTWYQIAETDPSPLQPSNSLPTYIMLNFGPLPLYLQPGQYSFFCQPDSNYSLPARFKILYKHQQKHSMVIVNGILFFTYTESDFSIRVREINLADTSQFQTLTGLTSKDSYLSLNSQGQILTVTVNEQIGSEINAWVIAYQINGYNNKNLLIDKRFSNQEKVSSDAVFTSSQNLTLMETPDLPAFEYTGLQTGPFRNQREWRGMVAYKFGRPWNPPFHLNYLEGVNRFYWGVGNRYVKGVLKIFLQGDKTGSKDNSTVKFKSGDFIVISPDLNDSCLNRPMFYVKNVSRMTEMNKAGTVYSFDWTILECELCMKPSEVPVNGYIYLWKGKKAKESVVEDINTVKIYPNYSQIIKEEQTIPSFQIKEKAEPVKLQNKDVVVNANFEVIYEDGTPLSAVTVFPSSTGTYQVKQRQGTDFNETWIYFSLGDVNKKILVTYDYVDPEKEFGNLIKVGEKIFFTESKTGKLISFDGTDFKEEGLTYLETQADESVRTITESIKINETKVQSNLVYDQINDRIYGIIGPGDNVLFQYAKDIALYVPDCKFLDKNVLQVLGECARVCNFVVYMDDEGRFHFVNRDYNREFFRITEDNTFKISVRQAAYEFGETYEKITVRFDGGEVVIGEGMLEYSTGSDYIASRGWAKVLADYLSEFFTTHPQIFTITSKFAMQNVWAVFKQMNPLDLLLIDVSDKSILSMATVQRVTLDHENQKLEIIGREKK